MAIDATTTTLLKHIQAIKAAFAESDNSAGAFASLATIPDMAGMPWNTFRTRAPVVLVAWEAGHACASDTVRDLEQALLATRSDMSQIQATVGKSDTGQIGGIMEGQIESDNAVPATLAGWSINQHKRGFFRGFRKVKGKCHCVYLGMKFDPDRAREKLEAANAAIDQTADHDPCPNSAYGLR